MKCVQDHEGTVQRVDNDTADAMVASGNFKFIAKRFWKALRNPEKTDDN